MSLKYEIFIDTKNMHTGENYGIRFEWVVPSGCSEKQIEK